VSDATTREHRSASPPIPPLGTGPDRDAGPDRHDEAAVTAADDDRPKTTWIRVAGREGGDTGRTSPRMRLDLLQVVAWVLGLAFVVAGLVALARAGFDELALTEPVVEVAGHAATPLLALLWLALGVALLAAGTGEVHERRLRIGGVVLAVVAAVLLIEPDAFTPYLGVQGDSGTLLLAMGVALTAASYVPPLSIARPGVPQS
jgi:hypothetical protein